MQILQQKQYKKSQLKSSSLQFGDCASDFIILDDKSYLIDFSEIIEKISSYGYNVQVIDGGKEVDRIINQIDFDYDMVVLAGDGGKNIFKQLK